MEQKFLFEFDGKQISKKSTKMIEKKHFPTSQF